ncbi:MAG TPA: polysaccharide deacetylase family protein [Phycisphaerae bacterium]|nr:polysaccharide deacetylase family protein [Phycisphaerae bacterium]
MIHSLASSLGIAAVVRRLGDRFRLDRRRPWLRRRRGAQPLLILPYHRVAPAPDDLLLSPTPPDVFEAQIAHVTGCYRVLPLEAALDALFAGGLPPRSAAITFDDGYRDNLEYAYPILKKYNAPATIFLATDFIGSGRLPPHDGIARAVRRAGVSSARMEWKGRLVEFRFDSPGGASAAIACLTGWLRACDSHETAALLSQVAEITKSSAGEREAPAMLSWDEARSLRGGIIAFGSHGRSHVACARLTREELDAELSGSRAVIERELGARVRLFAYPFGKPEDIGPHAPAAAARAGYEYALTTVGAPADMGCDRFAVPRGGPVWETRAGAFAARLAWWRFARGV